MNTIILDGRSVGTDNVRNLLLENQAAFLARPDNMHFVR
jgi:hypothetical protein